MPERLADGLSALCAAAVMVTAVIAHWDFPTALVGSLAAALVGMLAGLLIRELWTGQGSGKKEA
ncbi:MAG: hypothetical protein IT464_11935 [Planctomycetes bacterium]|nr:hypothetical protein [Planctomycetota bacterium]